MSVGSVDVRWEKCDQVHNLIKVVEDMFTLRVITPVNSECSQVRIKINNVLVLIRITFQKYSRKKLFFRIKYIAVPKIFYNPTLRKSSGSLNFSQDEESLSSSSEFSSISSENCKVSWMDKMGNKL